MRIVVRLAGATLSWRFKDSDRLGSWIDSRPWLGRSTVSVIRVADQEAADCLFAAVSDAVTAADRGATGVSCSLLDSSEAAAGGFKAAVAIYFGLSPTRTDLDLAAIIGREAASRPTIWLVPQLRCERSRIIDETDQFLDLVSKIVPTSRLNVIYTDTPHFPLTGRCFDLVVGSPVSGGDLLTISEAILWPHYVHRRIAWEAGGNLSHAQRIAAAVESASIGEGDDETLETVMNREAARGYSQLSSNEQAQILEGVRACVVIDNQKQITIRDKFWHPEQLPGATTIPWVARALLQLNPKRQFADFLRAAMLCLPISQELLVSCFLIETHIRSRVRVPIDPPEFASCHAKWNDFLAGGSLYSQLCPSSCPAAPTGPWAFASLGEILAHEISKPSGNDWRHRVRELRNHLAHGHHVGWEAIRLARRLACRLVS